MSRTDFSISELLRDNIRDMKPYSSARSEFSGTAEVFLDANENYQDFVGGAGRNRYPDPLQRSVKREVSRVFSIDEKHIFLGNGSDEAIDLLYRAFTEPGRDNAVIMPPTYGVYSVFANLNGVSMVSVDLDDEFQIDVEGVRNTVALYGASLKLVFICSPNNPTANDIDLGAIREILDFFPGIVVVDEAYQDFSSRETTLGLLGEYKNLVVLRTLSKAWGLANARLGMAFAHEELIGVLTNIKYPYNISGPAQETALAALAKVDAVREGIETIIASRETLVNELERIPYVQRVYPSAANFVLVKVTDADRLYGTLKEMGIIIRNRTREAGCTNCVRITIGSEAENSQLITAMKSLEGTL